MRIGSVEVPFEGPKNAKIMLVGEAPGEEEVSERRPFVGKSGQFLERYLGRVGVRRSEVYLANLCKFRPSKNKFFHLLGSEELTSGLKDLGEAIQKVKPNVIIALGNWPMYYLTGCTGAKRIPGSGITNWRGSVMPSCSDHMPIEGRKVLITYHPAFIVRPEGFGNHPIFMLDLAKGVREGKTPDLNYPKYESLIDPLHLHDVATEMSQAEWVSVDIETFGEGIACIGFADSEERGLCITYEGDLGVAKSILTSPAKKIFQYGAFDINYLEYYLDIKTNNYVFDTYVAAAHLMPEFKRGLDFLTSVYTDFPFYKEERKTWKLKGDMRTLWEYNVKDCIATYMIAMEQMKELENLYGKKGKVA